MSVVYCEYCDEYIDTDFDVEHFDEDENCFKELEDNKTDDESDGELPDNIINPKTMKPLNDEEDSDLLKKGYGWDTE